MMLRRAEIIPVHSKNDCLLARGARLIERRPLVIIEKQLLTGAF